MEPFLVRELGENDSLELSADIIRQSFKQVAIDFNLTPENCATNPAFITVDKLLDLKQKQVTFFGLFVSQKQVGFIGVESNPDGVYFMEKLAVLPQYRHHGYGAELMKFALEFAVKYGACKASLGTINGHTVLKNWYKTLGFHETAVKKISSLPFDVCFMEIDLR